MSGFIHKSLIMIDACVANQVAQFVQHWASLQAESAGFMSLSSPDFLPLHCYCEYQNLGTLQQKILGKSLAHLMFIYYTFSVGVLKYRVGQSVEHLPCKQKVPGSDRLCTLCKKCSNCYKYRHFEHKNVYLERYMDFVGCICAG